MTKKKKLSQEMIDAHDIAVAKQRIANLGLDPDDIMPKLQAKMGQYACTFVNEAMYPGYLCNRTGEPFQKSKTLITTYANEEISDTRLAKALGARTESSVAAKIMAIQEAVAHYAVQQDFKNLSKDLSSQVAEIKILRTKKEERIEERIDNSATLRISRPQEPAKDQSAVLKTTTPEVKQPASTGFKLEPVSSVPFETSWKPSPSAPASIEQIPLDSRRIDESKQAKTAQLTTEDTIRQKAQEELARLKNGKTGELTLDELTQAGISDDDMRAAVTTENMCEIHAGPKGKELGKKAKQIDAKRRTVGRCASATGDTIRVVTGYSYQTEAEGVVKYRVGKKTKFSKNNGTTQTRAMRKNEEFYTFDFENNIQDGNPEIKTLTQPGTWIGWEAKSYAIQPLGHAAIMGPDGNWHCDITQPPDYMASNQPAKRYQSDTYTIGFYNDCTASDKLAEEMLYQKYAREEREKQATQTMVMAQNER